MNLHNNFSIFSCFNVIWKDVYCQSNCLSELELMVAVNILLYLFRLDSMKEVFPLLCNQRFFKLHGCLLPAALPVLRSWKDVIFQSYALAGMEIVRVKSGCLHPLILPSGTS